MNQVGQQLLAGAAFPQDEGAGIGIGHFKGLGRYFFQGLAFADDLMFGRQFFP